MVSRSQKLRFRQNLLNWGCLNRRQFYWRTLGRTPYEILICEMMLRKTNANRVEPIATKMFSTYPSIYHIARARIQVLSASIKPLGFYNMRALAIHNVACRICNEFGGNIPRDVESLMQLPHVGRYTASATLCFAYDVPLAIVDANVARIYNRVFGIPIPNEIHKADSLWLFAQTILPRQLHKDYNWALLDFGALVCSSRNPKCTLCPVLRMCCAYMTHTNNYIP